MKSIVKLNGNSVEKLKYESGFFFNIYNFLCKNVWFENIDYRGRKGFE